LDFASGGIGIYLVGDIMNYRLSLGTASLCSLLALSTVGCKDELPVEPIRQYVGIPMQGRVVNAEYIEPRLVTKDNALFGNATTQIGDSCYSFELRMEYEGEFQGNIFVSVSDTLSVKKEAIKLAIEKNPHAIVKLNDKYINKNSIEHNGSVFGVNANNIVVYK
jgi:hypothetical protein